MVRGSTPGERLYRMSQQVWSVTDGPVWQDEDPATRQHWEELASMSAALVHPSLARSIPMAAHIRSKFAQPRSGAGKWDAEIDPHTIAIRIQHLSSLLITSLTLSNKLDEPATWDRVPTEVVKQAEGLMAFLVLLIQELQEGHPND